MLTTWMQAMTTYRPIVSGAQLYDTAGTYQWTCPEGVTKVCCVLVSPGQSALFRFTQKQQYGGAGGGLRYKNDIVVVPGQVYTIVVSSPAQTAIDDNDVPCTAFGISVAASSRGSTIGSNGVFGGVGGEGGNSSATAFNVGGSFGGHSGTFTNGSTSPGLRGGAGYGGGNGISIPGGVRVNSVGAAAGNFGGGGGNSNGSGPGGKGAVYIMWGPGKSFPNNIVGTP